MSKLELSAGFMAGLPHRIISAENVNNGIPTSYLAGRCPLLGGEYYQSADSSTGFIQIFKGDMPTDFTTLTLLSSRASDKLLEYNGYTDGFHNTCQVNSNPAYISTIYKPATASGLASWFRIVAGVNWVNDSAGAQIIGSIGEVGSGADLEVPDANFISGNLYRIVNLALIFPSVWTY